MGRKKTLLLNTNPADLKKAGDIIRRGGLVVFPTETVYGLGANARNPRACAGIYAAKGRPGDNPLIVHLPDPFKIPTLASEISPDAALLIEAFMPGPLTIILPKKTNIPSQVTAGLPDVGIRIPSDPVARDFLRHAGVPVAAPSANLSGRPSPTSFEMAWEAMEGRADAVIRGGDSSVGLESTILRLSRGEVEILRSGKISQEDIARVLEKKPFLAEDSLDGPPPAPGMRYRHYQPQAELVLYTREDQLPEVDAPEERIGILALGPSTHIKDPMGVPLIRARDVDDYARRLYASFFVFDKLGCTRIYAFFPSPEGIGQAVRDRLLKAAGGRFAEPPSKT